MGRCLQTVPLQRLSSIQIDYLWVSFISDTLSTGSGQHHWPYTRFVPALVWFNNNFMVSMLSGVMAVEINRNYRYYNRSGTPLRSFFRVGIARAERGALSDKGVQNSLREYQLWHFHEFRFLLRDRFLFL